jgi:hypothetical protein
MSDKWSLLWRVWNVVESDWSWRMVFASVVLCGGFVLSQSISLTAVVVSIAAVEISLLYWWWVLSWPKTARTRIVLSGLICIVNVILVSSRHVV